MRTALALAAAVGVALAPSAAFADRRELYVVIGLEPALLHTDDAYGATGTANTAGGALSLSAYYGLTNTVHVGAALRTTAARNIQVSPIAVPIAGGTRRTGTLYEDLLAVSFGGLALYRFDTGYRAAPTLSLELGGGQYTYSNRAHAPAGAGFSQAVPSVSYFAFYARPAVGLEYRLGDRLVAGVAVAAEIAPAAHQPWSIAVPFSVGVIW
jgi:hypothetical protein